MLVCSVKEQFSSEVKNKSFCRIDDEEERLPYVGVSFGQSMKDIEVVRYIGRP
jgi:hypothetical protein